MSIYGNTLRQRRVLSRNVAEIVLFFSFLNVISMVNNKSYEISVLLQESCSIDGLHKLYKLLNSMSANLDQLADNCCSVNGENLLPSTVHIS